MDHHAQYRVYYEDTDSGGVVYYANYLKFTERARSEMLMELGINQEDLIAENVYFVVKNANIDYISSAKLMDMLEVCTKISKLNHCSMTMDQIVKCKDVNIFTINVVITCVSKTLDGKFKPTKIPENIKLKLSKYV